MRSHDLYLFFKWSHYLSRCLLLKLGIYSSFIIFIFEWFNYLSHSFWKKKLHICLCIFQRSFQSIQMKPLQVFLQAVHIYFYLLTRSTARCPSARYLCNVQFVPRDTDFAWDTRTSARCERRSTCRWMTYQQMLSGSWFLNWEFFISRFNQILVDKPVVSAWIRSTYRYWFKMQPKANRKLWKREKCDFFIFFLLLPCHLR